MSTVTQGSNPPVEATIGNRPLDMRADQPVTVETVSWGGLPLTTIRMADGDEEAETYLGERSISILSINSNTFDMEVAGFGRVVEMNRDATRALGEALLAAVNHKEAVNG